MSRIRKVLNVGAGRFHPELKPILGIERKKVAGVEMGKPASRELLVKVTRQD